VSRTASWAASSAEAILASWISSARFDVVTTSVVEPAFDKIPSMRESTASRSASVGNCHMGAHVGHFGLMYQESACTTLSIESAGSGASPKRRSSSSSFTKSSDLKRYTRLHFPQRISPSSGPSYQPSMRTWSKGDLSGKGWLVFSQQGLSSLMFDDSRPRARSADDFADVAAFLAGLDGVDGVEVGQGRGFNDVGRGGAAAEAAVVAFDLELQRHLALRVLALGHAAHDELVQVGVHAGDSLNGLEDGVDRPVADRRVLDDLAVGAADRHGGRGQDAGTGRRVQAQELPGGGDVFHVLIDQRLEIVEDHLNLLVGQSVAQLGHAVAQRVPAGVLAQDEIGSRYTHVLGPHDLVSRSLLEHAVLVNSRLVGECVAADDRLVPLHEQAGDRRDHPAGGIETLGLD